MHEYGLANFDEQTLAIVEYVEKLTKTPSQVTREDVSALRSVVLITSMYAFMNRLADGLGVQLDKEKRAFVESWSKSLSPPN